MAFLCRDLQGHSTVEIVEIRRELVRHPPIFPADHTRVVRGTLLSRHLSFESDLWRTLEVAELLDSSLILLYLVDHVFFSDLLLLGHNLLTS